ncbi:uncharacterized protein [Gossypium hirsutum]|uniref:Reverse transcriptase Ty1/copia-type domain-containing protein n=1 Tax=Gossypium hirsutum TaxID=3635 RepID=A0ABM2YNP4_GOSHI|nr:uncharacterized protein LOC121206040 [Gossypium hirsutum]
MNGRSLRQIDVNNALRNGALPEEIYMDQPSGFEVQGTNGEQLVCKLNKILYGLRQGMEVLVVEEEHAAADGVRRVDTRSQRLASSGGGRAQEVAATTCGRGFFLCLKVGVVLGHSGL